MPRVIIVSALALAAIVTAAWAQPDFDAVEIETVPVKDGLYMLVGAGGNIGLSVGDDGTFLVDDQYAPLTEKIQTAVKAVTDDPVRFLVNTHWHGDHTGGNENFGKAGSIIVAHSNVRKRMSVEQLRAMGQRTPPSPDIALPKITFNDEIDFYWNGDDIHIFHVSHAHTDGDAIIYFKSANLFHMGDTFFNGRYPFIDINSGGNIQGVIDAADRVLTACTSETQIIPGHGPLSTPDDLRAYRDMLMGVRDRVQTLLNDGKSAEDIVAAAPTKAYDSEWQTTEEWTERFVQSVIGSLKE